MNSFHTLKFETKTFPGPKIITFCKELAIFEHTKQLSPLAQHPIPTGSHVIKFRTDSNLNLL
jgi:hypothetical protein